MYLTKKALTDKQAAELMYEIESMDEYYSRPFLGIPSRWRVRKILKELKNIKGRKILDIGCEAGYITMRLAKEGAKVTAVDFLDKPLKKMKTDIRDKPALKKNIIIRQADARKLPFTKNSFDIVIAAEIIEHMSSLTGFIKKVKKVLKPHGKFLITFPHEKLRRKFYPFLTLMGINAYAESIVTLKSYKLDWIIKTFSKDFKLIKHYRLPWWLPITHLMIFEPKK